MVALTVIISVNPRGHGRFVELQSNNLVVGQSGSISVRIEAKPKPNITWTRDGKDIAEDDNYMTSIVLERGVSSRRTLISTVNISKLCIHQTTWKIDLSIKTATEDDFEKKIPASCQKYVRDNQH